MGVFDKFMGFMKIDNDDDYDDFYDDYDDEGYYDDDYEDKQQRPLFGRKGGKSKDDYDDFEAESDSRASTSRSSKVTPMRQPVAAAPRRSSGANMEVCVVKPTSVDDSREITETLLNGRTVILNLEGMDLEVAQRIIDFISGAAFAINGNLQKISNYIFLVMPTNVDISGDLQDLLSGSMEQPTVKSRF